MPVAGKMLIEQKQISCNSTQNHFTSNLYFTGHIKHMIHQKQFA